MEKPDFRMDLTDIKYGVRDDKEGIFLALFADKNKALEYAVTNEHYTANKVVRNDWTSATVNWDVDDKI